MPGGGGDGGWGGAARRDTVDAAADGRGMLAWSGRAVSVWWWRRWA